MKSNPQIIRLDITNPRANAGQIVHIVGGDACSRLVEAIIYDNGETRSDLKNVPAQLYIEPLSGKRPIFIDIVIVDGISTFTIPQSAGVTAGRMNAAVRIVSDDATEILSSMPFIIECSEPVYSESAVIGTDEADTLKAMVNDARESADTAASLAKTASDASSDAAKYAGECMNYARSAYESSVSAADSAESAAACIDAATQSAKTAAEQVLENKVDKSQVVSHLSENEQIPNGAAAVELCHETILQEGVSSAEPQGLTDEAKAIARENIGAAKEQGTWELLFTITGDGTTRLWEMTELSDGSPISLSEVACVFNNEVASAKNGVACLTASAKKNNASSSYQINSVMTGVGVNTNTAVKSFHRIFPLNGYWHGESAVGSSSTVNNYTYNATYAIKFPLAEYPKITAIKVYTQETTPLPEGSTVTVWGIRI